MIMLFGVNLLPITLYSLNVEIFSTQEVLSNTKLSQKTS